MQFVQIQLEVLVVIVNLNILEMVSLVLVIFWEFLGYFVELKELHLTFFKKTNKLDIDECLTNNGGCEGEDKCVNTFGGFYCECEPGHMRNGSLCIGIFLCFSYFFISDLFYWFLLFYFLFSTKKLILMNLTKK